MRKLYFVNDSDFDIRAMMTFGVSAKDSDEAIGFFGTGFKYAVAIILRLGGSIEVKSGDNHYIFEKRREEIRGKNFDVVYMNGENAGFTTHLGAIWEPWMAFRELYSNCLDENGTVETSEAERHTSVIVDSPLIYSVYSNKGEYFIDGTPLFEGVMTHIYQRPSNYVYYKGVAVANCDECEYSFNIQSYVKLSEERTAAYSFQWVDAIAREIQSMTDPKLIRSILSSGSKFCRRIAYSSEHQTSGQFLETVKMLMATDVGVPETARRAIKGLDEKAGSFPAMKLTKVQQAMVEKSLTFLKGIGVTVEDFPIYTVKGLGAGVMGRAIEGNIYISEIPFQLGVKQVASTLMEEWVHNKFGYEDLDRNMQSWLFDKILSIGEEMNGEPI